MPGKSEKTFSAIPNIVLRIRLIYPVLSMYTDKASVGSQLSIVIKKMCSKENTLNIHYPDIYSLMNKT
jgi:hypothetical protein